MSQRLVKFVKRGSVWVFVVFQVFWQLVEQALLEACADFFRKFKYTRTILSSDRGA